MKKIRLPIGEVFRVGSLYLRLSQISRPPDQSFARASFDIIGPDYIGLSLPDVGQLPREFPQTVKIRSGRVLVADFGGGINATITLDQVSRSAVALLVCAPQELRICMLPRDERRTA